MSRYFTQPYHWAIFAVFSFSSVPLFAQPNDILQIENQVDELNTTASKMLRARQYNEALNTAQQAVDLSQSRLGKENPRYATAMNWLGGAHFNLRQMDKAEACYLDAIDWRAKTVGKKHRDYARPVYNLAMLYLGTGAYDKALPLFLESQQVISDLVGNQHPDYAIPTNGLATLYMRTGHYEKAEPLNLAIISIREKTVGKMHPDYAQALYNLGILYVTSGRYMEAEPLLLEAKNIQEQLTGKQHPEYAKYLSGLANLYLLLRHHEKVEPMYLESIAIQEQLLGKNHPDYIMSLNNLGILYTEKRDFEKAASVFDQITALAPAAMQETHPYYATILSSMGNFQYFTCNFDKSNELYQKAIDILNKTIGKEHSSYPILLNLMANNHYVQGNYEKAKPLFAEAKELTATVIGKNNLEYVFSLFNLGIQYQTLNMLDSSEVIFKESAGRSRQLLLSYAAALSESQMLAYLGAFNNSIDVLYSAAHVHQSPELIRESYNNALFFKGFLLENCRYLARSVAMTDSATIGIYDHWQSCRRRLAQEYVKPIKDRDDVTALENEAETLEKSMLRNMPAMRDFSRVPQWQEVQSHLPAKSAAIEFIHYRLHRSLLSDTIFYAAIVLLPGDGSPHFVPLCIERDLIDNLSKNKDVSYWTGGKSSLYNLIWAPLEKWLRDVETVYYAPDGLICNINPDAIALDQSGNKTLIDQLRLVRLGSTRQLAVTAATTVPVSNEALLFGGIRYEPKSNDIQQQNKINGLVFRGENPEFIPVDFEDSTHQIADLPFLPGTLKEVKFIENQLRKSFTTNIFTGFSASEEAFKFKTISGKLSPRVIHIATHGFSSVTTESNFGNSGITPNSERAMRLEKHPFLQSGLYFAGANHARKMRQPIEEGMEDGVLTAFEVSTLSLQNTELVVLSACKSGLGAQYGRDGLYGLQRAFKIAGVKYLILSLWQVPDEATEELMSAFYANWLNKKMDIPAAFRQAQLALKKKYKDPEMWAGFVLVE